jgi:hypothetical protein
MRHFFDLIRCVADEHVQPTNVLPRRPLVTLDERCDCFVVLGSAGDPGDLPPETPESGLRVEKCVLGLLEFSRGWKRAEAKSRFLRLNQSDLQALCVAADLALPAAGSDSELCRRSEHS